MKSLIANNYEDLSQKVAALLVSSLQKNILKKDGAVFLPSAGKSPTLIYKILRDYKKELDWQKVIVVQMDDYIGNEDDSSSFRDYLMEHFIGPLNIKNFLALPKVSSIEVAKKYITHHERIIKELGGIDLALHGIGRNGHIGFNEPGSEKNQISSVFELAKSTLEANQDAFKNYSTPRLGMSLGLQILSEAKENIVIASGETKREAILKLLNLKNFCSSLPVSLFLNTNTTLVTDFNCT